MADEHKFGVINPLNPELNPICYLLSLLGAHHFLHVSRIRVKSLTLRLLMSYIYMEHLFLMSLDHTQRHTTVCRTPLDERSARRRDLYLTTHDTHNRQISMPPVGFEPTISAGEQPAAAYLLRSWVRIPPGVKSYVETGFCCSSVWSLCFFFNNTVTCSRRRFNDWVTGCTVRGSKPSRGNVFLFSRKSRLALRPSQSPVVFR